jgi:hypothetical protein
MDRIESIKHQASSINQQTAYGQSSAIATGKRLYIVQQTLEAYPAFSLSGLRHLIF